jgi:ribosomal subunit interface protein
MLPVQITIRDIPVSAALESHIRKRAEKLSRFNNRIISCRVVVELPQKHKRQGKLHNIRIDITVPGKELVVTRKQDEDIYIAIRDAFNAVTRVLEEHSRKRHGHVKTHDGLLHGHVARLMLEEGYGFIDGIDGNEYYFSLTNVAHPHFKQLAIGDTVQFLTQLQGDGWHAQHVIRERRNHKAA